MAEVQKTTQSGELTQRFIEFVLMQAQQAALFLGQIPNPQTGKPEVNLDVARMLIDQLAMIQEKTRGNLTTEETTVIRNALSGLQMAFFEASQHGGSAASAESTVSPAEEPIAAAEAEASPADVPPSTGSESDSRKKFTKTYGA
jgi:hypothetical protein